VKKKLGCAAIRPPVSFTLVLWFSIRALEHSSSRSPARTSSLMWQTVVAEVTYRCGGRQRPRRRLSDSSTQIALLSYVTPLLAETYPPFFLPHRRPCQKSSSGAVVVDELVDD